MKTVDLIAAAIAVTREVSVEGGPYAGHDRTLVGQRKHGSQWGQVVPLQLEDYLFPLWEVVPNTDLLPGTFHPSCLYFRTTDPTFLDDAVECVSALNALPEQLKVRVHVANGDHGPQFVLPADVVLPKKPAEEAWLILGPVSDEDKRLMIWTAYPGRLLRALDADIEGTAQWVNGNVPTSGAFEQPFAVKVV